ncbi:MAG: endonuclease, partial [Steroidobacteraceae bacterium]
GDASKALFANGVVTFKRAKDGTTVDIKRLAADHPVIAAQYTATRAGSRRFVLARTSLQLEGEATC